MVINSLFMAFAVQDSAGLLLAFGFPGVLIPVMAARFFLWRKRGRDIEQIDVSEIRQSLREIVIAATSMSVMLGIWAVAVMWAVPAQYYAFIPLFTILSTITCAYCLVALPAAIYSVILTGSLYLLLAMGLTGDFMMIGMAANILLVCALLVYMATNQFAQMSRIVAARSDLHEQHSYANQLAHHDHLTNMPNRRAFMDALARLHTENGDKPVSVVMVDLNGFKPINDTYGHAAGDQLLIKAGECLTKVTRSRWHGRKAWRR